MNEFSDKFKEQHSLDWMKRDVQVTQVTDETFQQEVLASETPVLVDFYADWCGPCKAAAPVIDAITEEFKGRVKTVKINVDADSENAVKFGVRGIPNFIIFKGGLRVAQFVGNSETLAQQIREVLETVIADQG